MVAIKKKPTRPALLRRLSAIPLSTSKSNRVDRDMRVIFGCALIQKGDLNDSRPWFIDDKSLRQVLSLVKKAGAKGLKSRFTHPNMSNDGLGSYLARLRNPRLSDDGETVLVDAYVQEIAFRRVDPELGMSRGEYILDMAINDPDALGLSLDPDLDLMAMEKEQREEDAYQPMRFVKLRAGDFVDEPASTRGGLFGGAKLSIATAPRLATNSLDSLFADASEDVIRTRVGDFLDTYLANRFSQGTNKKEPPTMAELTAADVQKAIEANNTNLFSAIDTKLSSSIEAALAKLGKAGEQKLSESEALQKQADTFAELTALAQLSGLPDSDKMLSDWIKKVPSGFSVIDAKAQLGDLAIKHNKLTDGDPNPESGSLDRKLGAAYDEHSKLHKALGISKEEWIKGAKAEMAAAAAAEE